MKKLLTMLLAVMLGVSCLSMVACGSGKKYKITDATDLIVEDFGIAVKKGNTDMVGKINATLKKLNESGEIAKMVEYFTAVADGKTTEKKYEYSLTGTAGTITMHTESGFAPFEFVSNTKIVGVDIAIMSEVAKANNMKLKVVDGAFDSIVENVNKGDKLTVGAAGMTITADRLAAVDFSDTYFSTTLVILAEEKTNYTKIADLTNLKVGVQQGTTGDLTTTAAATEKGYIYEVKVSEEETKKVTVKVTGVVVKQYAQYAMALADLKNGKIDVIVMDKIPAQLLLSSLKK